MSVHNIGHLGHRPDLFDTLAFSSTQLSCHEPTLPSLPFSNFLIFLVGKMDATPNANRIPEYNDEVSLSSSSSFVTNTPTGSSASSALPTSQFVKKVQRQLDSTTHSGHHETTNPTATDSSDDGCGPPYLRAACLRHAEHSCKALFPWCCRYRHRPRFARSFRSRFGRDLIVWDL